MTNLTKFGFYRIVGERLRMARVRKGWSRRKLQEKSTVNRTTIYYWEMGLRGIQLYHFALVCAALDLSVEEVLRGSVSSKLPTEQHPTVTGPDHQYES